MSMTSPVPPPPTACPNGDTPICGSDDAEVVVQLRGEDVGAGRGAWETRARRHDSCHRAQPRRRRVSFSSPAQHTSAPRSVPPSKGSKM
jgi:hypothetical protein